MQKRGQKLGTAIATLALIAVAAAPTPSAAFGVRLGPFFLGIPLHGHRHHHATREPATRDHVARAPEPETAAPYQQAVPNAPAAAQNSSSALLYPALALPAVYDDIFAPTAPPQPWPFSYEAILQAAFGKSSLEPGACQRFDGADAVMARIQRTVRPTPAQMPQLQKLGGAVHMAGQYLSTACPSDVRAQPTARLQLMEWQIEKLAQAVDIVRPPLMEFEQSLTDAQRARFAASAPAPSRISRVGTMDSAASTCAVSQSAIDRSIEQISQSVQPTDAQRDGLAKLKDAFSAAAGGLDAHCPTAPAADPLARLQAVEARLDASWRAVVAIQSALADFEKNLSDEQRARLDATDFAAL